MEYQKQKRKKKTIIKTQHLGNFIAVKSVFALEITLLS